MGYNRSTADVLACKHHDSVTYEPASPAGHKYVWIRSTDRLYEQALKILDRKIRVKQVTFV